jgi:hypothetical protein
MQMNRTEHERVTFCKSGIHGWGLMAKQDLKVRTDCPALQPPGVEEAPRGPELLRPTCVRTASLSSHLCEDGQLSSHLCEDGQLSSLEGRGCHTAKSKLRIVMLRFGTARQRMVLE